MFGPGGGSSALQLLLPGADRCILSDDVRLGKFFKLTMV